MEFRLNRQEIAGSLGDLGTLLPMAIGMILVNGLSPAGTFLSLGLFYIISGYYYRVPVAVQPMLVIGAYAIAEAVSPLQLIAAGGIAAIVFLLLGITGLATVLGRIVPTAVIRGVQLSTGILLVSQGAKFILGDSTLQQIRNSVEPYFIVQHLGPFPLSTIIGIAGGVLTLYLLNNRRFPAGLTLVLCGMGFGILLGTHEGFEEIHILSSLPSFLPRGMPGKADFAFAFLALVLPQTPMTLGNAIVADADLSRRYFGRRSYKVSYRALCITTGIANILSFLFGGMPLAHGAGGLASRYRFGSRTEWSNYFIGMIFVLLSVLLGSHTLSIVYLVPMGVLGVLLFFAGVQLSLTISDVSEHKDMFVMFSIVGITLASNLAIGFIFGVFLDRLFKLSAFDI